jgi:hypothetical protein
MVIASDWYNSAALWGASGLAGVLIVGFVTVFVTYRVGGTKRQLTYGITEDTKLLGGVKSTDASDLKVLFRDQLLGNPRILRLRLASRGRRDIRTEDFDQSRPLVLNVGIDIIALISAKSDPEPLPRLELEGRCIKIGPDLIRRRQTVTIAVLADGTSSHLTQNSPLIDVDVQRQTYNKRNPKKYLVVGLVMSILGLAATITAQKTGGKSINVTFPAITEVSLIVGTLLLLISSFFLGMAINVIATRRSLGES